MSSQAGRTQGGACAGVVPVRHTRYSQVDGREYLGASVAEQYVVSGLTIEGQEDFWRECAYVVLVTKELTLLDVGIECSSTATDDEFASPGPSTRRLRTCENFLYSFKAGLRPATPPAVRPVLAPLRSGRSSAASSPMCRLSSYEFAAQSTQARFGP